MRLRAKAIRPSRAKFHCNRLTTVQDIQDYVSLILAHFAYIPSCGGLSWLPVSFLLHVKYPLSYRIVSYT